MIVAMIAALLHSDHPCIFFVLTPQALHVSIAQWANFLNVSIYWIFSLLHESIGGVSQNLLPTFSRCMTVDLGSA